MGFRCRLVAAILLCCCTWPALAAPIIAGGAPWRPYTYEDDSGQLTGLSIDIARRVMQLADVQVTFVAYPVNRLQAMLQKGEIDLNYADARIWNSPEDQQHYLFSRPYSAVREHLYFLADHPARDLPVEQLNQLTIGTVRGYTYPALDPTLEAHRLKLLETSQDDALLKLLESRRVDAVAMVDDIFNALVAQNRLDPAHFRQGAQLSEAPLVFKLQPQYAQWLPRINQAIETMSKSGELERIRRRYIPSM